MKIITIAARMTSTRLPGKVMMDVAGKPMLEHQIERLKRVNADKIVLATTINATDDCLVDVARRLGIDWFRGSEENVLGREIKACEAFNADTAIQTTADCPVIDPSIIEQTYSMYVHNECKWASNGVVRSYPIGMDTQVFNVEALKCSADIAKEPPDREHVGFIMRRYPVLFPLVNLVAPPELYYPELRLTLDYQKDYIVLKDIIEHFDGAKPNCLDIIEYLKGKEND